MNPHRSIASPVHPLRRWSKAGLLLITALMGGCSHVQPSDEGVGPAQALAINSFRLDWNTPLETNHGPVTRLYSRDTMLFGYTEDGTSYVLDRATGNILYATQVHNGEQALHPPVVLKDLVVYPTNTSLEVYDRSGALVRSKHLGYLIRSDAVGSKNFVYFGADAEGGGRLMCVDATGEYLDRVWALMFPKAAVSAAPAVLGDIVYVAAENGEVTAVATDSREPVWPMDNGIFQTYAPVVADIAADETGVYVASADTKLVALNRNNGKVKWQFLASHELRSSPVVTKDTVFQQVPGVGMVAIDKLDVPDKTRGPQYNRKPRWTAPDIIQILAEDNQFVYALRGDRAVLALDKQTGQAAFSVKRRDIAVFATNTKDGTVYGVTTGNRVVAIAAVTKPGVVGELAWKPVKAETSIALAR